MKLSKRVIIYWASLPLVISLILIVIAIGVLLGGGSIESVAAIGAVGIFLALASLLYATWKWVGYSFDLREDVVIVSMGVLLKKENRIPYEKIQNVKEYSDPLERFLGIGTIQIETAAKENIPMSLIPGVKNPRDYIKKIEMKIKPQECDITASETQLLQNILAELKYIRVMLQKYGKKEGIE